MHLEAPSAEQTALALHQAISRKTDPGWPVCGVPDVFYTDHGSDFTSVHLQQVAADLRMRLVFSTAGVPRGRGKIEQFFRTVNTRCLAGLPGHDPAAAPGTRRSRPVPPPARLSVAELDQAVHTFVLDYLARPHGETKQPPARRWRPARSCR